MQSKLVALSFGIGALLLATDHAFARQSQNCDVRNSIVERLAQRFGETRRSVALSNNNTMVEIFASTETGSWSITITHPNGRSCLVASGHSYEPVTDFLPSIDSDV